MVATSDASAAVATSFVTRRRAIAALVIFAAIIGVSVYFAFFHKKGSASAGGPGSAAPVENMRLVGENLNKQLQCYQDSDCPNRTFCDSRGMCVPSELLPRYSEKRVLGRGRGGEGADVMRVAETN